MRANSGAYSFAFSLPVVMRQSETRRLRYCQTCSVNSGCARLSSKTVVSGLILPITRLYVASDIPRARARARNPATHCSKLPCADNDVLHAAIAPASIGRQARLDGRKSDRSLMAPCPGIDVLWRRFYSCFCRLCGHGSRLFQVRARQRQERDRRRRDILLDLLLLELPAPGLDQPLVGCDQRHVGVDEHPAVFGRHLDVEMEMIGGGTLAPEEVADLADDLALAHQAAAHHAVGVELPRQHVQVAKADALVGGVGDDIERFLVGSAQHGSVAHRHHLVQIGLAAVRSGHTLLAEGGADVLPLVSETGRALADVEVAGLAEIVAPGIGIVLRSRLVGDQDLSVYSAAIGAARSRA